MYTRNISINPELFLRYPGFKRGVIVVKDINVAEKNKRIKKPLNKIIKQRLSSEQELVGHPYVKAWEEAHRNFGSNPNKYPPSIKALLTRILNGSGLPFINSVVTLFNYISIKYIVPCGGDDLDRIKGNLCLGFATGKEKFIGLGSDKIEYPEAGEVIYYDDYDNQVMCRRWNWRNAEFSKITLDSKRAIINIDGINGIPESIITEARDELAELLKEYCDAELTTDMLSSDYQEVFLPIK